MELNELISFITNNGIAVVLMVYFLRNNYKSTQELILINKDLITEIKNIRQEQVRVLEVVKACSKAN